MLSSTVFLSHLIFQFHVCGFVDLAVAIGFILLNEAAKSTTEAHKGRNKVMAIAGIALVAIFFSALKSIFRAKYQGYPYSFLFK